MLYLLNGDITFDMITQACGREFSLAFWSSLAEIVVQWKKSAQAIDTIAEIWVAIYGNELVYKAYMYALHGVNQKSGASFLMMLPHWCN